MKKTILPPAILLFGLCTAQVGINTANPKATFHIDGGKDNPINNDTPTIGQQTNDFVVTSNGNVGVATIAPTEKLEVNGKTKINDLPVNGTAGFTATKTLVASDTGVVGVLNGLPSSAYNGYQLTSLKGFDINNAFSRSYSYNELVSSNCFDGFGNYSPSSPLCAVPASTIFNEVYKFTFDKKSSNTEKYLQMNIDYYTLYNYKDNTVPPTAFYNNFMIKVMINDIIVKTYDSSISVPVGGGNTHNRSKSITADLSGINLNPTNNIVKIYYNVGPNIFKANTGTSAGNFVANAPYLLTQYVQDFSFQLYEK
ncbi:hypothetical protein [Chryseobacterium viscerum]|uniref:Uncharacterized protein n=1 Tax=Chryseobacterium viscerum TaxID=1037377 RepID=A0A316WD77_9FLAO|nr:hypothetical protein [Chryseobacterium viscerum]PWN58323.1 hypothetical protein C1634_022465 [Chryseobacterium viscerum]